MVDGRDDEDTFGDFSFVSNTNFIINNNNNDDDDDDWGDFVESPLKSHLPITNNTLSRPKGPLPLSLFGQDDDDDVAHEEEERSGANGSTGNQNGFSFGKKSNGVLPDLDVELFGEKNDIRSFRVENVSGSSSVSGFVRKSGDFSGLGNGDLSGLGSNLAMGLVNNGEHLNHGLFGEEYDNRGVRIENVSGLISESDLFAKSRSFSSLGNGSLGGLSSDLDLFDRSRDLSGLGKGGLSGFSSNSDLFARSTSFSSIIKGDLNGLSSNSDLFAKSTSFSSLGKGNLTGSSSNLDTFSVNNNGFSYSSDLFGVKNGDHNPQTRDANVSNLKSDVDLFMGHNENNLASLHSGLNCSVSNMVPPSGNEDFEGDDDAWEFKDANSEWNVDKGINSKVNGNNEENSKVTGTSTQAVNGSHESIYFPSATNGISVKSLETDFSFDFTRSAVAQNGMSSDSFFNSKQSGFDTGLKSDPLDSNEMFGDFHGALSGNGLKEEDVPMTGNGSPSVVEVHTSNSKAQVNETRANNHNEALPLSFFGDEELESDDHINAQEDFSYKPSSTRRDGINSEDPNYCIHDVISNLYRQPQQNPSVENPEKITGNGFNSNPYDEVLSRIPGDFDEDFDDDSWEFKDASARTPGLELSSHLVFYCKLEEQLSIVCRCHLDNLKKARDAAAFSGEDAKLAGIEEKIQEAYKVLQEETSSFVIHSDNQTLRETSLDEFLEVLNEPKFQVLESQYQLSTKLLLAQKDLTSAIDAMKHTKSKLNILTIGSSEDQYNYVSTWYKIISVCAQELKHGSWIWKQSIENSLLSHMVSDPRGKDFVISLAEIYRVVIVLRASTKLFEPWILSISTGIFSLLEDCYTLWSSLRIEEALDLLVNNEYQSTVKPLLESIKHIHDLDELALRDVIFHKEVSTCRLSLLSSEVVPEINMVMWNGETFFVTLANLWVNLVNCDLPDLPRLQVAS